MQIIAFRKALYIINIMFRVMLVSVLPIILIVSGCTYTPDTGVPESDLRADEGMAVAFALENRDDGRIAGWGRGESMEPIFSDNTVLVTNPIEWDELEKGMLVAYYGPGGDRVVHSLLFYSDRGNYWRAKGINNLSADGGRVTRENLIGVVYASIQTEKLD